MTGDCVRVTSIVMAIVLLVVDDVNARRFGDLLPVHIRKGDPVR